MNYTLHQLRLFLKINETKSITKAAEELHLTQPAVSIQLRKLQEQFDIPLTEVIGRQLYITPFGKEIALASQRILDEVYRINQKTASYKGLLTGKLKLSIVSTGKYVMPSFLSGFTNKHHGVDLTMDVTNKKAVLESLKSNEVDFALVSVLPDQPYFESIPLLQNKLFLVGSSEVKSTEKKTKHWYQELPFIFREEGSATRQAMERFIANNKLSVGKQIELTSNEAVKQAVISNLGISIMPLIGLKNELQDKELYILADTALPITTTWHLIWLKEKEFSPAAEAYLNYISSNKETIVKKYFGWYENY